jgi:hypothetical protein
VLYSIPVLNKKKKLQPVAFGDVNKPSNLYESSRVEIFAQDGAQNGGAHRVAAFTWLPPSGFANIV